MNKSSRTELRYGITRRGKGNNRIFICTIFLLFSLSYLVLYIQWVLVQDSKLKADTKQTFSDKEDKVLDLVTDEEKASSAKNEEDEREAKRAADKIHYKLLHEYRRNGIGEHEPLSTFLISSILKDDELLLPKEGSFLDCGAQFGEQGAHYAVTSPHRKVIAMDPSPKNIQRIKDSYGSLANLEIRQGGLGREVGTMKPRDKSFEMDLNSEFQVFTLDSMFFDKGEKLAFAHLDVEGLELDALQGGVATIRANKPVFTVELRVHETNKTTPLLDFIDSLGYDTYVIDEPCGWPYVDLRNVLCIPRRKSEDFGKSDGFNLMLVMGGIQRVTSEDITQRILPCCALGGECCPGNDLDGANCCTEKMVFEWHNNNKEKLNKPVVTLGFKEGRQEFLKQQYRLRMREKQGRNE